LTGLALPQLHVEQGPGIVPQDLPCIFDAYYQAETERSRRGSGLGLALARWVT